MASKDKQFCKHEHDTFVCGRDKRGRCNNCRKEDNRKYRPAKGRKLKQFCPQGHDTFIFGRSQGRCKECLRIWARDYRNEHLEECVERLEKWKAENKEHIKEYNKREWANRTPEDVEKKKIADKKSFEKHRKERIAKVKQYVLNHPELVKEQRRKHAEKNKEKLKAKKHKYYEEHKEEIIAKQKKYREEHLEQLNIAHKKWVATHKAQIKVYQKKCASNRSGRIVAWTDWDNILEIYKNCPDNMTVDHVIPLCGKLVWGLEVSWNMQYLTPHDNFVKNNRVDLLGASAWYGEILKQAGLK